MPANSPQEVAKLIAKGLSDGDLDGTVVLYEPSACLVAHRARCLKARPQSAKVWGGLHRHEADHELGIRDRCSS